MSHKRDATEAPSDAKARALRMQLAQLERDGSKLDDAVKFLKDLREDQSFKAQAKRAFSRLARSISSDGRKPTDMRKSQKQDAAAATEVVETELSQLQAIRSKLMATVHAIDTLTGSSEGADAPGVSGPSPGSPQNSDTPEVTVTVSSAVNDKDSSSALSARRVSSDTTVTGADGVAATIDGFDGKPCASRVGGAVAALEAAASLTVVTPALTAAASSPANRPRASSSSNARTLPGVTTISETMPLESVEQVSENVRLLEAEAAQLRELNARRNALRDELTALQPKASIAQSMKKQIEQLKGVIAETDKVQAEIDKLTVQAEQLPVLQAQYRRLQASAQEARTIKTRLQDHQRMHGAHGMDTLVTQLQSQEADLIAKTGSLAALRERVESMATAAREVEELEKQFTALAPIASRLPMARAQIETIKKGCSEVEELEKELDSLKDVVKSKKDVQKQIDRILPHAEAVDAMRIYLDQLQQLVGQDEPLRQGIKDVTAALASNEATAHLVRGPTPIVRANNWLAATRSQMSDPASAAAAQASSPREPGSALGSDVVTQVNSSAGADLQSAAAESDIGKAEVVSKSRLGSGLGRASNLVPVRLNLKLEVVHPLPGVPEDVVARLQAVGDENERHRSALEELDMMDKQRQELECSVAGLANGPAAISVLKLQHRLLELQTKELESLEQQVASMAGVGERLAEMRQRLAALEQQEEELMMVELQVDEAQEAHALQQRTLMERSKAEIAQKELAALEMAAMMDSQRQSLQSQIADLRMGNEQISQLQREVASLAFVPVALSKLRSRHQDLSAKAQLLESLRTEVKQLEASAAEVEELQKQHSLLVRRAAAVEQLPVSQASQVQMQALTDNTVTHTQLGDLRTQVQEHDDTIKEEHDRLQAQRDQLERDRASLQQLAASVAALSAEKAALQEAADKREALLAELQDPVLRAAADEAVKAEEELKQLKQTAETLARTRVQVTQLHEQVAALPSLQAQAAALQQQLAAAGHPDALRAHLTTLRKNVDEANVLQRDIQMLAPQAEEARALHEQIQELTLRTADLPKLREQHSALLRDAAAMTLLQQDVEVLTLRQSFCSEPQVIAAHVDAAVDGDDWVKGNTAAAITSSRGDLLDWARDADIAEGLIASDGSVRATRPVAARNGKSGGNDAAALDAVFARLRRAEAERAGLEAENHALTARVDELSLALGQSQVAVEKLRNLIQVLGRIRGAAPESASTPLDVLIE